MKKAVIILTLLLAISAALNIIYIRARVSGGTDGQTDAWQQVSNVDTRVVHTVQFRDQAISFDPTATYIIHGRRFACKKIELKITDRGLSPLKTGYFYEIKD